MAQKRYEEIHQINYLTSEMQALYHRVALKLGISDSVCVVLYSIYDAGETCLLSDIYKKSGISKQTVNSAMRNLETEGMLYLVQHTGRAKRVVLTDKGRDYVKETVARLYEAEVRAFDDWTDDEIRDYITGMERYAECLRIQLEQL